MDNNKGFFLDKKIVIRNCNKEDHEKEIKLLTGPAFGDVFFQRNEICLF